ncbi:elongation factor G [Angelakisella massiliensis]|uniref:elongation factor G n=1 Tax=Angelakisella massiliensis TaxID=1871018 RepID=UPI0024B25DAA|nr:elongation factor G [Angelakisella massiliensis]
MKQFSADKIRNVAITGHSGAGKTSLAEAMLYRAKTSDRLGRVVDGNTVCDFDPEEIKRKVSVSSAVAPMEWKETKINLIDCPGLFDFEVGMVEGIRAAESVLIVVSGKSGVNVGTEKAYKAATKMGKSKLFYVNKMDRENADFTKVLAQMKEVFGNHICPMVVPYVENHKVVCYVNLVENTVFAYDASGQRKERELPAAAADYIEEMKNNLYEAIAETSEELMDKFFSGEPFTQEEISSGLLSGVKSGTIAPVFCGSALTTEAIHPLLNAMISILPSAADNAGEMAVTPDGKEVMIDCDENQPFAGLVFKTVADPFVGKLSFIKVVAGRLTAASTPVNTRTGEPERLGKLICVKGKKQEDADAIFAGDIGAVTKLSSAITGDTLCDPKRVVSFKPAEFPKPCLTMAITVKNKGDEGKIAAALARLMEEDPAISYENNVETKQQLISGLGEQHLDVIVSKLKNKFGVDVGLEKARVAYRETIRKKVKVQGRHKKQSGGHGQFGDVWIEFEPCDSEGLVFEENVFGGAVPKNFFPAVEKGLQDCVKQGVLAGYPVVGLKATLVDGSYHPVDSSEMAFKTAASLAYKAGLPQAGPVILEPIGTLKVYVPDANTGDIIGELNKRRGRVLGMNPTDDKLQEIVAEVPMSEMGDFATTLRSISQGRGSFTLTFERYEQLPQMLEASVIEEAKALRSDE